MVKPQEQGCKDKGGARPRSTILESSVWAAGDTAVAPCPLTDDGVLTCCLSTEGVSGSGLPGAALPASALPRQHPQERSRSPPGHHSFARSALTLFLQQKAVFTPTAPIWPSAINLHASNCSTLCDNSLC